MPDSAREQSPTVTLHSSWTGILLAVVGALGVVAIAVLTWTAEAALLVRIIATVVAVGGAIVILVDMPIATTFTRAGLTRRCLLRKHTIPWDRITRLTRVPRGLYRVRRRDSANEGGLVALIGTRQYSLVDQMEGRAEFDALLEVIGVEGDHPLISRLIIPHDGRTPTWSFRRSRWRPDSADRR